LREISLHILDIVENGISAGANHIKISVDESRRENRLKIVIEDNGSGIKPEFMENITDPFVTSRTTRRVGLGLSLLKAAALRSDGDFTITSEPEKGTCVSAIFVYDHIDRMPVGDMAGTISTLIICNPEIDFVYTHVIDGNDFFMDTREIRKELKNIPLYDPQVIKHITETIEKAISELGKEGI